jgi:hypothetical protein
MVPMAHAGLPDGRSADESHHGAQPGETAQTHRTGSPRGESGKHGSPCRFRVGWYVSTGLYESNSWDSGTCRVVSCVPTGLYARHADVSDLDSALAVYPDSIRPAWPPTSHNRAAKEVGIAGSSRCIETECARLDGWPRARKRVLHDVAQTDESGYYVIV